LVSVVVVEQQAFVGNRMNIAFATGYFNRTRA
jgi:hypothetical protein